ncbi:3-oxoacyl-ACP reductase family protein [Zavarzinella formosa]|uniref:3-oxoacyl-ACP reductase family protein n=1 Tax=Zavarzinella formosa TaxID=360055 RepID=UPI0002DB48DC|nr:3-oxoacyl-ACP reductase family protein [Zavarzinella formosa]
MSKELAGKVALVTGGSRGIGAAIVRRLAQDGAHVAFTYVSQPEKAAEMAKAVQTLGVRALAIRADSVDPTAVVAAVEKTASELGGLDILVNNAGVVAVAPIEEFKLEDFDRTMAINVRAVFVATQAAVRHMKEGGRVITIGSCNADRMPFAGGAVYAMSKSALVGLVKGLARDLGPRGITINNIQPGPVDTDMNPANGPSAEALKGFMALKHYGHAEDVAGMVAYLANSGAGFVTGASLTIDGGFNA